MALSRIQIALDKADLVRALRSSEQNEGIFSTYGDVLTFAAALGFHHKKRVPFEKASRRDPDPVLQEQFRDNSIISLLAFAETRNPNILAQNEDCDRDRAKIFQEYANGGLEILQDELKDSTDLAAKVLLMLENFKNGLPSDSLENFDLSIFL